jgi:tripartite ATP-independent transporter DctM subunit
MSGNVGLGMLAVIGVLVILGVDIGVALALGSVLGLFLIVGSFDSAISLLGNTAYEAIRDYSFAVIPLFVLMGDIVGKSGLAADLYKLCNRALARIPGRLAVATVAGNAVFAAVTGVSIAAAAAFSRIAYPEMMRHDYRRRYAVGCIAGSACLGMLIPPSVLMIVWAILTEMSVGKLFVAAIVPGVLLALMFAVYCAGAAIVSPAIAPPFRGHDDTLSKEELRRELIGGLGVVALIALVIGGIWGGLFNPTEAAGVGVMGAIVVGWAKGMTRRQLFAAMMDAARTTAPIMFLLITAQMYSRLLALSGVINTLQSWMTDIGANPMLLLALITVVWFVLGMLVDSISIILLTVPVFAPLAPVIGMDPYVFAIYGILVIEAGLLTPPFGLLVYTVKVAVPDPLVTLADIFAGSTPYWIMLLLLGALIYWQPQLALWLTRFT